MSLLSVVAGFVSSVMAMAPTSAVDGMVAYKITDLGFPPFLTEGNSGTALSINQKGQVTGRSDAVAGAVLWTPGGTAGTSSNPQLQDLGALGTSGNGSYAQGINDNGQVVGESGGQAFLWTPGGTSGVASNPEMQNLGTLGGSSSSYAYGINDSGQVVGRSHTSSGYQDAFLWTPGGTSGPATNPQMQDLGRLADTFSQADAINNSGQVVGYTQVVSGNWHAFLWVPGGGMRDLGTLAGELGSSYAFGINDKGQVVGSSGYHAFMWTPGGTAGPSDNPQMQDLGTLGGSSSYAYGINDSGQVVGSSGSRAFLWTPGTGMQDLNSLVSTGSGGILTSAYAINSDGDIAAVESLNNGYGVEAVELTPVPEPPAILTALLGTGAAMVLRKRRRSLTSAGARTCV